MPDRAEAIRVYNWPYRAVEEALSNAVYHRSYQIHEPITVTITPEKIEILSLPGPDRSITDDDLKKLKAAKFDSLYTGLETAYDPALEQMKKGYTAKDEYIQLKRLEDVDMEYNSLIMLGVAGRGNCKAHIEETLKLLNNMEKI